MEYIFVLEVELKGNIFTFERKFYFNTFESAIKGFDQLQETDSSAELIGIGKAEINSFNTDYVEYYTAKEILK
jgi:hypothetical protein